MTDGTREVIHERKTISSAVAWLALILSILALSLAWLAYNRSGTDLETRIQNQINRNVNPGQTTAPAENNTNQ